MLNLETTLVLLRTTAFISVLLFTACYALSQRKYWVGFAISHIIHLGFILWYGLGLEQPMSLFTVASGAVAYLVIINMFVYDLARPGAALRLQWGLHFIWFNLFVTFPMMIVQHWDDGFRPHSWLGAAIMLSGAFYRFRSKRAVAAP